MDNNPIYKALLSEEPQERIEAVRGLNSFAQTLGPERVAQELLPQLKGLITGDDDEVAQALAEELGALVNLLTEETTLPNALSLLAALCASEEENIRKKATTILLNLSIKFQSPTFSETLVAFTTKLAEGQYFTTRVSFCGLCPCTLSRASPEQKPALINLFIKFSQDSIPMTRRAAAHALKDILPHLSHEIIMANFVQNFQTIAQDPQDSVRFLAVDIGASLSQSFKTSGQSQLITTIIKPVVAAFAEDRSWRVRYQLASSFVPLVAHFPTELLEELLFVFIKLIKDSEQEVRSAAAGKVSGVAKLVSQPSVLEHILPCISLLTKDQSHIVRAAFAKDVMQLAPAFGVEGTNVHLLNIVLQLLKDDVPEVRLNVISKLGELTPFVGLEKLSSYLIPAIVELGQDRAWRVRMEVIKDLPQLAAQLQLDFFVASLGDLCFSWVTDTNFTVRQAAVDLLKQLTAHYGEGFSVICVPKIVSTCGGNKNYLHRITGLSYCMTVGPLLSASCVTEVVLPLVIKLASDPVANVRMMSGRALDCYLDLKQADLKRSIEVVVGTLLEDKDPDVVEAAQAAKKKL